MLQELEIEASELVKVEITDASVRKYNLTQNLSRIEAGKVVAVQAYNVNNMPTTPEGKPLVNQAVFNAAYLTLKDRASDTNDMKQTPLQDLQRSGNSGIYERIKPLKVDMGQSIIEIGNGPALTVGEVFMFRIMFIPDRKC